MTNLIAATMRRVLLIVVLATSIWKANAGLNSQAASQYKRSIEYYFNSQFSTDSDARADLYRASEWLSSVEPGIQIDGDTLKLHNTLLASRKLVESPTCESDDAALLRILRQMRNYQIYSNSERIDKVIDFILDEHSQKCRPHLIDKIGSFMDETDAVERASLSAMARQMKISIQWYYYLEAAYAAMSSNIEDPLIAPMLQGSTIKSMTVKQFDALYNKYILQPCKRVNDFGLELGEESEVSNVLRAYVNEEGVDQSVADYYYASIACNKFTDPILKVVNGRLKTEIMDKVRNKAGVRITKSFFSIN